MGRIAPLFYASKAKHIVNASESEAGIHDGIKRANHLLSQGRFREADGVVEQLRYSHAGNLELFPLQVRCRLFLGQHRSVRSLMAEYRHHAGQDRRHLEQCAELFSQCQRPAEAAEIYRRLAQAGDRNARYNLAANLLALGDLEQAESILGNLVQESPTDGQAQQVLSGIRRVSRDASHIPTLEQLVTRSDLRLNDRIQLHYALGKEYEDVGEFDRAFQQFSRGAELRRATMRYRVEGDLEVLQLIAREHGQLEAGDADRQCGEQAVFVFGLPRSGTTLVDRILSSHSQCDSFGEITDLPLSLMVAAGRSLPKEELVRATAQWPAGKIAGGYLARLGQYDSPARKHIDKTPQNFLYAGLIARSMPGATMVWMDRHPLDACFAMYKTLFRMGYPFSYSLRDLARYYIAYHRLRETWQESLAGRLRFQSYEQLVGQFDREAPALVSAAGLEWATACGEFHRNSSPVATASSAQVRQPLYTRSVGHWQHYREQLAPLAEELENAGIAVG